MTGAKNRLTPALLCTRLTGGPRRRHAAAMNNGNPTLHRALLALALLAAPALADVRDGSAAWARGDYRKAVEEWRGPAVAGDAVAQFNLGQAYKLGRGVPVDPTLAESWFRKAALQGLPQGEDNYALALFQNGRAHDAVPWLEKSVARDEPRTELVYGTMLFNGDGAPRDYPRAYALMTRAAAPRGSVDGLPSARETLQQMDGYISPAERQRGVALAQQYALAAASRPPMADGGDRVTEQGPSAAPIQVADAPSTAKPPRTPKPATAPVKPPKPATAAPPKPVVAAAPKPAPRPAPPAAKGAWRIQLGAFRDRGNAEALWAKVRGKLPGAAPAYVAAGGVTRLQATGFAGKAAAQAACARSGTACNVVAP